MEKADPQLFEQLQQTLSQHGRDAAIDQLCASLEQRQDYSNLFYALLMKKRCELGVCPVPTESADALPEAAHAPYEEGIRTAGRHVGELYLRQGDIPHAWMYFRMLGETEPVHAALEQAALDDSEQSQQVIEIAFHHGVHPRKGFDWILDRYGLCSAITMVSGAEFPHGPDIRNYCIRRLVRSLYHELRERLAADIERREGTAPSAPSVRELMQGRDWLFEDEFYHIDVSHLGAVVQMSIHLNEGEELELARELCEYGQRLSPRFQYAGDPPFENQYRDYGVYLTTLCGVDVEEGIASFRAKAERADPENEGTLPAEVLVNLLLRLDRPADALASARRFLSKADPRQLTCPGIVELCQRTKDYGALAEVAREQEDPVHFLAGLVAAYRA